MCHKLNNMLHYGARLRRLFRAQSKSLDLRSTDQVHIYQTFVILKLEALQSRTREQNSRGSSNFSSVRALPNLASMLRLENHPVARNKAVALSDIRPGTCILREVALASILLPAEKGRRCDTCFRGSSVNGQLKRCSGCASYWYCSAECKKSVEHPQFDSE